MITEKEAMEYEAGTVSVLRSLLYRLFPSYFIKVSNKRYARYRIFMEWSQQIEQDFNHN